MFNIFFPFFDTSIQIIDYINKTDKYYHLFYLFVKKEIDNNLFKLRLKEILKENKLNEEIIKKFVLINLKNKYNLKIDYLYDITKCLNPLVYDEYIKISNNIDYYIDSYIDYYNNIINNFAIENYPINLILDVDKKYIIYDGIHRFIICYYLNKFPTFVVIKSELKCYNYIIEKIYKDYQLLYKNNYTNFALYNKIPHFLFDNYECIREDRSDIIINYLSNKNIKNGLEIGCQNGLLSIQLINNNYNMTIIEYDKEYCELTTNIMELCNITNTNIINDNIYNIEIINTQYDFIVSLSVFYHLKRNNKIEFELLFKNILKKTKYLFFDDEIRTNIFTYDYILSLIDLENYEIIKIYTGNDDRSIYVVINLLNLYL